MNKQFVANVTPKDKSLERMIEIIIEELKPAIGAMVDEKLKEAGVSAAGGDMAANLASKYTLPGSEFEAPDSEAPRASNGRKMPSLMDGYQLPD